MLKQMIVLILFSFDIFGKSLPLSQVTFANYDTIFGAIPSFIFYYKANETHNEENKVEFETALDSLGDYAITAAEVDCDTFVDACKKLNLTTLNLPLIRVNIHSGWKTIFRKYFEANEIVTWVHSFCSTAVSVVKTDWEVKELYKKYDQVTIGYFNNREAYELKLYQTIAHKPQAKEVFAAYLNEKYSEPILKHFRPRDSDDIVQEYSGPWEVEPMLTFVQDARFPLIGEINASNAKYYLKSGKPLGYFLYNTETSLLSVLSIKEEGLKVAKRFKGKMVLVHADHAAQKRLIQFLGLLPEHLPGFVIEAPFPSPDPDAKAHYPILVNRPLNFGGSDMNELVVPHIERFLNKTLALRLRSMPRLPAERQTHPVVTVVGDSFNETVIDNDRYVFVKFTMPWGASKPEFKKVAEEIVSEPRVVLAEFDCSQNDYWPAYYISEYPTLMLFSPPNKNIAKKCTDCSSVMKIKRFLKENIPDVKIDVDYQAIVKEDEEAERKKRAQREEWKRKIGEGKKRKRGRRM